MKVLNHKRLLRFSLALNICFLIMSTVLGGRYIRNRLEITGGGYLDNTQYNAYLTMFELNPNLSEVVFLGDSITARGRFEEFFPETSVLNRGIGSDTSEGVLNRMEEVIGRQPGKIFLMIGINDLIRNKGYTEIVSNVRALVEEVDTRLPECTVFIQSVLPAINVSQDKIKNLNGEYKNLAEEYPSCHYIDLYSLFLNGTGSMEEGYYSPDGVHLNGNGYEVWIRETERLIGNSILRQ